MQKIKIPKPILISVVKLKRNKHNVKQHPKGQIDGLVKLIQMVGFKDPVVIDKKNVVWAGHGRLDAAFRLGMRSVPCIYVDQLTEEQKKAFMLMDNRINESPWDVKNVELVMAEIPQFDFGEFKMEFNTLLPPKPLGDAPIGELPENPETKLGDIWELGDHRLMCGNAMSDQNLVTLLHERDKPILAFMDPPYDLKQYDFMDNLLALHEIEILTLHDDKGTADMLTRFRDFFIGFYIITFNSPSRFPNQPMMSHRLISHFRKGKSHFVNLNDAFATVHEITLRKDGLTRHEKPIELPRKFIAHYTEPGDIVLDLFGSSGSTLIAAEYLGRICYTMEIKPGLCELIKNRLESYNQKTAKKI